MTGSSRLLEWGRTGMIFGLFSIVVGLALSIYPPLALAVTFGVGLFLLGAAAYLTGEICARVDMVGEALKSIRERGELRGWVRLGGGWGWLGGVRDHLRRTACSRVCER